MNYNKKQRGGEGHQGHTVIDSVYHGRPEYGFYSAEEMIKMGAKVGGASSNSYNVNTNKNSNSKNNNTNTNTSKNGSNTMNNSTTSQRGGHGNIRDKHSINHRGGDGHQGHTVIDSVYHGRPEYGFYSAEEMAKMGAKVGGSYIVEKFEKKQKSQRGGFAKEEMEEHKNRIQGLIENMIDVSDSHDLDIVSVLQNEINPETNQKYGQNQAKQILKEYYLFNSNRVAHNSNGLRTFPSNLLKQFMAKNQTGGNRVVLPLTFFTGEIPNKITVPPHIDNYCE